jgi:hypothetical protein
VVYQDGPILEVEMEGGTQGFQDAKVHWEDHDAARMGFRVSAHDDSIDLEMAW